MSTPSPAPEPPSRIDAFVEALPQTPDLQEGERVLFRRMTHAAEDQKLDGRWLDWDQTYKLFLDAVAQHRHPELPDFMAFQTCFRRIFKAREFVLAKGCEVLKLDWMVEDEAGRKTRKTVFSFKPSPECVYSRLDFFTRLATQNQRFPATEHEQAA